VDLCLAFLVAKCIHKSFDEWYRTHLVQTLLEMAGIPHYFAGALGQEFRRRTIVT
jgi:hypothetical protein